MTGLDPSRLDSTAFVGREFERTVDNTADALEALARQVRRTRSPQPNDAGDPGFGEAAQSLVGLVMSAMPNLGLDQVIRAAQQADHLLLSETPEA